MKHNRTPKTSLANNTRILYRIGLGIINGCLILAGIFAITQVTDGEVERVTDGLVVLYDFQEGRGSTVRDMSGVGNAMDLTIDDPANVSWLGDRGISVNAATVIKSSGPATKITNAVMASGAITIEAWVRPANNTQDGPARIATLSKDGYERNFTLAQDKKEYRVRLRTDDTSDNGTPELKSPDNTVNTSMPQHVVYTFHQGDEKLYVDGVLIETDTRDGSFVNWNTTWSFGIANELTKDRNWLGEVYLVAVYDKAINQDEISQNYLHGVDNFPYFEAIVSSLPGQTAEGWSTHDLETDYEIDFIGTGWHAPAGKSDGSRGGSETITLAIPNPETVSHILIETISLDGDVLITYTTALGSASPGSIEIPKAGTSSSYSFQVHRAILQGDPSVSSVDITTDDAGKAQSVTATIFREVGGSNQKSVGLYVSEWFYRNSKTYNISIPTASTERDLTITIPVSEMSNDNRYATFTATAGSVMASETISTYDPLLGESLRMVTLTLAAVPGSVSSVSIVVLSPNSDGDSFAIGGAMEVTSVSEAGSFPVEWTHFDVEAVGDAALLKWGTAQEINSDRFVVERSIDGRLFENISSLQAAGTTDQPQTYQYQDNGISALGSSAIQYRLRQVDLDGSFSYSEIQELSLEVDASLSLTAYPNPVMDVLHIAYQAQGSQEVQMRIVNLAGQIIEQKTLPAGKETIQVLVNTWPRGNYFIHLADEANSASFQFIVK